MRYEMPHTFSPAVLVIEDDKPLRDVYVLILESAGYYVDAAANGQIALEKCGQQDYDLLLLDLRMPVMDGVSFLKHAHLSDQTHRPKVIIFSNLPSGAALEEAWHLGVDGQIMKSSLTPQGLLHKVDYLLHSNDRQLV
jgi:two-component system chemotaxis response regulator CheY